MSTETKVGAWHYVRIEPDVYAAERRTVIVETDDLTFASALDAMDRADELTEQDQS